MTYNVFGGMLNLTQLHRHHHHHHLVNIMSLSLLFCLDVLHVHRCSDVLHIVATALTTADVVIVNMHDLCGVDVQVTFERTAAVPVSRSLWHCTQTSAARSVPLQCSSLHIVLCYMSFVCLLRYLQLHSSAVLSRCALY